MAMPKHVWVASLLLAALFTLAPPLWAASSPTETWVEGQPLEVRIQAVPVEGGANITVTLVFSNAGYAAEWGEPSIEGNKIFIDVSVSRWTGPSAQVITEDSRSFTMTLEPGEYTVVVRINGEEAASKPLTVPAGAGENGDVGTGTLLAAVIVVSLFAVALFPLLKK